MIASERKSELNLAYRDARRATRYPSRPQQAAVVKLVYTQASGACGLYARGGSSPLSRTSSRSRRRHAHAARDLPGVLDRLLRWTPAVSLPLSSRGLGRRPLTAET